jgi:hypothetical protein
LARPRAPRKRPTRRTGDAICYGHDDRRRFISVRMFASRSLVALASALFLTVVAAAGCSSKVGDSCEDEGSTSECEENAICSKTVTGSLTCQKLCSKQEDCPVNTSCNGVSKGSQKSCRPNNP